jgi:hypothetical protein
VAVVPLLAQCGAGQHRPPDFQQAWGSQWNAVLQPHFCRSPHGHPLCLALPCPAGECENNNVFMVGTRSAPGHCVKVSGWWHPCGTPACIRWCSGDQSMPGRQPGACTAAAPALVEAQAWCLFHATAATLAAPCRPATPAQRFSLALSRRVWSEHSATSTGRLCGRCCLPEHLHTMHSSAAACHNHIRPHCSSLEPPCGQQPHPHHHILLTKTHLP